MRSPTLQAALTFPIALVFAAFMWGCDETPQNPVAPSQTQAGTAAGSGSLVTSLHGKPCKRHHKEDPGCDGGDGGGGEPTLYSYDGSGDVEFPGGSAFLSSTPAGPRIVIGDSEDNDTVKFGSVVLDIVDPMRRCFADEMNFGGSLRDWDSTQGAELRIGVHALDKKGKQRQYEFRAEEIPPGEEFPPTAMRTYWFNSFIMAVKGNSSTACIGSPDPEDVVSFSVTVKPA